MVARIKKNRRPRKTLFGQKEVNFILDMLNSTSYKILRDDVEGAIENQKLKHRKEAELRM